MSKFKYLYACLVILLIALSLSAITAQEKDSAAKPQVTIVRAGKLFNAEKGTMLERQVIVIEGERIKSVGPEGSVAAIPDAKIVDLSNATVLPGFIDSHVHITGQIENYLDDLFRKTPVDSAVIAHIYAKRTLEAGFTSARVLGSAELVDVALKRAINEGKIPGPRLFVATLGLSATGGHGDLSGFSPYLDFAHFNSLADGIDEIRKKVRWEVKYGADVIKFTATAGVLSEEESVGAPQFSFEEMLAIVEESKRWGKTVAAHAHGTEGIKMAVKAGVTSIEHGSLIDDEGINLMKRNGTYLVPTIFVGDAVVEHGKEWGLPEKVLEKAKTINATRRERFRKAVSAGIKIAYGTDAGVFPHGMNAADFPAMVELGMTPAHAIQSATIHAASLLGMQDHIGSISAGKFADLIAVREDPLVDIKVLWNVGFVMKGGTIYKNAP